MPNGKNGVNGPNAQLLVVRGPKSGPVAAVNQPLKAFNNVLEIQQRLKIVSQLNAQVNFYTFSFSFSYISFCSNHT